MWQDLISVGLTDAVHAAQFDAGLTPGDHARLHVAPGEVLQLVVDVEVSDAAVETGHVQNLRGEAERGWQHFFRHPCGGYETWRFHLS